jgi:hypothetical protein
MIGPCPWISLTYEVLDYWFLVSLALEKMCVQLICGSVGSKNQEYCVYDALLVAEILDSFLQQLQMQCGMKW